MKCVCKYDSKRDLKEVTPGMSIDIVEVVATGVVAPVAKDSLYNALDDISKVGKRVRDIFDAYEAAGDLNAAVAAARTAAEKSGSETV